MEAIEAVVPADPQAKRDQANKIVRNYALASVAPSLIPVPMLDLVLVTGIQLKMLHSLAKNYGVKFREELGRSSISALIGGAGSLGTSRVVASAVKGVPFVGSIAGAATLSVLSGATTYALGKVFVQHFESGGTFLTFKPEKVREYFQQQIEEGKAVVAAAQAAKEEPAKK